jgi:hypothetical protein
MEVLHHIKQYFGGIFPYIGLIYGRYLRVRFLKWPLIIPKIWMSLTIGFHLAEVGIRCPLQWGNIATVEYCEILHHLGWFFSPWNNGMFTTYQLVQDFAAIHSITLCMSQTIKDLGGQRLECLCLVLTIQLLGPPVMLDGLENQLTIWHYMTIFASIINQCETGVMFTNLGIERTPLCRDQQYEMGSSRNRRWFDMWWLQVLYLTCSTIFGVGKCLSWEFWTSLEKVFAGDSILNCVCVFFCSLIYSSG